MSDESLPENESHIAIDLLSSDLPPESSSPRSSPSLPPSPSIAPPQPLSTNEGNDVLDMFPVTVDSPCSAINRIHSTATNLSTALDVHVQHFDQLHNQVDTSLPECASVSSSLSPKRTRSGCAYTTFIALARPTHHRLSDSSFLASVAFNARHPFACVATTKYNNDNPSYSMALNGPNRLHFIAAMEAEHEAVKAKDTYDLCCRDDLPPHTTILPVVWVFRVKRRPDGSILKYKARICVRGDLQQKGIDFSDSYAPVVNWLTVRLCLMLKTIHGWYGRQIDYANAFCQAPVREDVFISIPPGFRIDGLNHKDRNKYCLKLKMSLYGSRTSPRNWFLTKHDSLLRRGFKPSDIDPCLFINEKLQLLCLVYCDDCLIFAPDRATLDNFILDSKKEFDLTAEDSIKDYLGVHVSFNKQHNTVTLSQ